MRSSTSGERSKTGTVKGADLSPRSIEVIPAIVLPTTLVIDATQDDCTSSARLTPRSQVQRRNRRERIEEEQTRKRKKGEKRSLARSQTTRSKRKEPTTAPKGGGTRMTTPTTGENSTGTRGWDQKSRIKKKRGPAVLGIPVPSWMTVLTKPLAA